MLIHFSATAACITVYCWHMCRGSKVFPSFVAVIKSPEGDDSKVDVLVEVGMQPEGVALDKTWPSWLRTDVVLCDHLWGRVYQYISCK